MKLIHSLSEANYMLIYVCVLVSATYFCDRVAWNDKVVSVISQVLLNCC